MRWEIQCKEDEPSFSTLLKDENSWVCDMLHKEGFVNASPIQTATIPPSLNGRNILAQSRSGTGKTISFLTLLFAKIKATFGFQALILSPTRELSNQIYNVAFALNSHLPKERRLRFQLLIGGLPIKDDEEKLIENPEVIIGTVGRVGLHFESKKLAVTFVRLVVLDEADVLIKGKDFRRLFGLIRHEREKRPLQICCYSATYSKDNFAKYCRYLYPCLTINNGCVAANIGNKMTQKERKNYWKEKKGEQLKKDAIENMDQELIPHEELGEDKSFGNRQSLNVETLDQYAIILKPEEGTGTSFLKLAWIVKILKSVNFEQCIIFYNDKGRGDQIVAELK